MNGCWAFKPSDLSTGQNIHVYSFTTFIALIGLVISVQAKTSMYNFISLTTSITFPVKRNLVRSLQIYRLNQQDAAGGIPASSAP